MTLDEAFDVLGEVLESTRYQRELDKEEAIRNNTDKRVNALEKKANILDDLSPNAGEKVREKARNIKLAGAYPFSNGWSSRKSQNKLTDQLNPKSMCHKWFNDDDKEMLKSEALSNKNHVKYAVGIDDDVKDKLASKKPGKYLDAQKKINSINASADMLREACLTILSALDSEED